MAQKQVNGFAKQNGSNGTPRAKSFELNADHRIDDSGVKEFGGVIGTAFAMVFFPLLMWYLWAGQAFYNGQLPTPKNGETLGQFVLNLANLVYTVRDLARPSTKFRISTRSVV